MTHKLVAAWFVMYAVCVLLSSVYQGGGGLVSTSLTASLSKSENSTMHVTSTVGFLEPTIVYIENEQIYAANKTATTFTGLTRAYNNTDSAAHGQVGLPVYTLEMGTINQAAGFQISEVETTGGSAAAPGFNPVTLIRAIPQVVWWNYPFLTGQLIYLRIILIMVGIGFSVAAILSLFGAFQSIITGR